MLQEESLSLHKYIYYEITTSKIRDQETLESKPGWILSKLDIDRFAKGFNLTTHVGTPEELINLITKCCDKGMPKDEI